MDSDKEAVETLRALFAPAAARLTPDIEPAFEYAWRELNDLHGQEAERDDE